MSCILELEMVQVKESTSPQMAQTEQTWKYSMLYIKFSFFSPLG